MLSTRSNGSSRYLVGAERSDQSGSSVLARGLDAQDVEVVLSCSQTHLHAREGGLLFHLGRGVSSQLIVIRSRIKSADRVYGL